MIILLSGFPLLFCWQHYSRFPINKSISLPVLSLSKGSAAPLGLISNRISNPSKKSIFLAASRSFFIGVMVKKVNSYPSLAQTIQNAQPIIITKICLNLSDQLHQPISRTKGTLPASCKTSESFEKSCRHFVSTDIKFGD